MPKPEPVPQQQLPPSKRTTSVRIVSTRSTNAGQSRLRSGGSVLVHDTDEEGEPATQSKSNTSKIPQPATQPPPVPPITRTRKAKETQLRLGVGRPKAVGGAGARAVTKSFSAAKNNKRVSKSVKISEAVIPEEQDPGASASVSAISIDICAQIATFRTPTDKSTSYYSHNSATSDSSGARTISEFRKDKRIHTEYRTSSNCLLRSLPDSDYQVRPLQEQIQHFQSEFERLSLQVSELTSTKAKLSDEVEQLKVRAHSAEDRLEKMSSEFGEFVREATAREQYVAESPS